MPINRTRVSRRDALKASAIFAAPFIAKYARAAGPMAGKRMQAEEAGLYTVKNGKIVQEEFFYDMGG